MTSPSLGDQCRARFTSDTPHFFKIILDDADTRKLRIPNRFAKRCGSEISSPVSLKVPNGAFWEVGLTKLADGTWLQNGWSEFAKHYSLSYGSFLVFRYEGNCIFHVIIFDKSATEITYPCSGSGTHRSRVPNGEGFQDRVTAVKKEDISVEILDEIPPSKKTEVRSPSPSSQTHKKRNSTSKITRVRSPSPRNRSHKMIISSSKGSIPVEIFDDIPPSKKTRVRPPSPSKQPHKAINSTSTISIKHSAMKSSRVKYEIPEPGFNAKDGGNCSTSNGISKLCWVPDVPPSKQTSMPTKISIAPQRLTSFTSENPHFVITTKPSQIYTRMNVPCSFMEEHIEQDAVNLTFQNGGKLWPVKVSLYPVHKVAYLSSGWGKFARENYIKAGYVCAFELIDKENAVLRVHILRKPAK